MNKQPSDRADTSAKAADDEQLRKDLDELLQRVDSLPTIDLQPEDEILGYDSNGIPASNVPCPES
jgi:hypothetical protein